MAMEIAALCQFVDMSLLLVLPTSRYPAKSMRGLRKPLGFVVLFNSDDYFPSRMSFFKIADRFRDFA